MSRRLIAAVTIIAIWAAVGVVLTKGTDDSPVYDVTSNGAADWEREGTYLYVENSTRLGLDPLFHHQWPIEQRNPNRVKILVVGDSGTYGHGARDLDMLWWARMEQILNDSTSEGTFEVIPLAMNGASMYRYADWVTPERIAQIKPDVVIIGLNNNDAVPTGDEKLICGKDNCEPIRFLEQDPGFIDCMSQTIKIPTADRPALYVRCTKEAQAANNGKLPSQYGMTFVTKGGPYANVFATAISMISKAVGNVPVGVVPMLSQPYDRESYRAALAIVEGAGWTYSPRTELERAIDAYPEDADLMIHPRDLHAGPIVTFANAKDAAALVTKLVPGSRIAAAKASAVAPIRSIVSNALPVRIDVEPKANGDVVVRTVPHVAGMRRVGQQFVPCAELGKAHMRVMLDPTISPGLNIRLHLNSAGGSAAEVYAVGYTKAGEVRPYPTG